MRKGYGGADWGDRGRLPIFQITNLSFRADSQSLAVTGNGKTIVLDVGTGNVRFTPGGRGAGEGLPSGVLNAVFSPDDNVLAVALQSRSAQARPSVQLWNVATGKVIRTLYEFSAPRSAANYVRTMAFSRHGKILALGIKDRIVLCDTASGKTAAQLDSPDSGQITGMGFTPDGTTLVAASERDGNVRAWDIAAGKVLRTFKGGAISRSMALSRDGKKVALGTVKHTVRLWEAETGKELFTDYQGHDSSINCLAFSRDGKLLASGEDSRQILLWDTTTWKRKGIIHESARRLAFSPDAKHLAILTSRAGGFSKRVLVWNVEAGQEKLAITVPDTTNVTSVMFSSDKQSFLTLDWTSKGRMRMSHRLRQWNLANGEQLKTTTLPRETETFLTLDGNIAATIADAGAVSISSDGRLLAHGIKAPQALSPSMAHPVLGIVEVAIGKQIASLEGIERSVSPVVWSADNRFVAFQERSGRVGRGAVAGNTLRIWDAAAGKEIKRIGEFHGQITALAFAPDGRFLVAGMSDSTIVIWDMAKIAPNVAATSHLTMKELEQLWSNLLHGSAGQAQRAVWSLARSPARAAAFLEGRLKPVAPVDGAKVEHWIAGLDDDKFAVRQTVTKQLEAIGEQAIPSLQNALKRPVTLETRRRLEQILNTVSGVPTSDETVRTIRAIIVLERIGTREARGVLEGLAKGAAHARETEEAKASLTRLAKRYSVD